MADISSIKLNGNLYNIKDNNAVNKNDVIDIAHGGTNASTSTAAWANLGGGDIGKKDSLSASDIPDLSASKITTGTLAVGRGGTGKTTHTANAILTGNGTNAVNNVATKSGAFYATAANGTATFGTLPVAQGGTGVATFTSGAALIGNGTDDITTRSITNNTSKNYITANTNLITANTLGYWNGAYNNAHASNISYLGTISRGTWQGNIIGSNYGGTGVSTATANYVFAAPAANNGTPDFRKLVASDIPNLNASKITAGTLTVGRGGTGVTTYSALAPHVGISTLQIATTKSDTYTFKSETNGEFAIIFCERNGRAGIYMVDYNTAGSVKVFNIGSIDPLITIQHSANNLNVTITNNNSVTMKITIIEMNTTS